MSKAFCADCDRSRVTADGNWYSCLYATSGENLLDAIRADDQAKLLQLWRQLWLTRDAQTAVKRSELESRQTSFDLDELLADPHLEMHTRGG